MDSVGIVRRRHRPALRPNTYTSRAIKIAPASVSAVATTRPTPSGRKPLNPVVKVSVLKYRLVRTARPDSARSGP